MQQAKTLCNVTVEHNKNQRNPFACTNELCMFCRCQTTMNEKLTLLSIPFRTSGSHSMTPYLFTTCCLQEARIQVKEWKVTQTEIILTKSLTFFKKAAATMIWCHLWYVCTIFLQIIKLFIGHWGGITIDREIGYFTNLTWFLPEWHNYYQ